MAHVARAWKVGVGGVVREDCLEEEGVSSSFKGMQEMEEGGQFK